MNAPCYIGITGGIASGKSTVRGMLSQHPNIGSIDLDSVARAAIYVPEHRDLLKRIFSDEVLLPNGGYNMELIKKRFFGDKAVYERASVCFRPIINRALEIEAGRMRGKKTLVLVESALLRKEALPPWLRLHYTIVVFCNRETQILRAMERSGLSRNQVEERLSKQPTNEERFANGDVFISTECNERVLNERVSVTYDLLRPLM